MVRAFTDARLPAGTVLELCDLARRAPSAGNVQATEFLVLDEAADVARYWDVTLPAPRQATFRWPGLLRAPALVVVAVRPAAYPDRYAEDDKAHTGLGDGDAAWPVPYWWVDAGAAAEHLLLGAVALGLGGCLFGLFDHESAVAAAFGVPDEWRLVATVAIGWPDHEADEPGRSAGRPRRPIDEVVHHHSW